MKDQFLAEKKAIEYLESNPDGDKISFIDGFRYAEKLLSEQNATDVYISSYANHWLQNQLVKVLQIAMNDNHKHSWIEYYMWELDFGSKYSKGWVKIQGKDFELKTASDLWDLLNVV